MKKSISSGLDKISDFFSQRKGMLPIIGMILVVINFLLRLTGQNWFTDTDIALHAGIILGILGYMLAWVL